MRPSGPRRERRRRLGFASQARVLDLDHRPIQRLHDREHDENRRQREGGGSIARNSDGTAMRPSSAARRCDLARGLDFTSLTDFLPRRDTSRRTNPEPGYALSDLPHAPTSASALLLLALTTASAQPGTVRGEVGAALDTYLTESVSPDFSGVVLAGKDGETSSARATGRRTGPLAFPTRRRPSSRLAPSPSRSRLQP